MNKQRLLAAFVFIAFFLNIQAQRVRELNANGNKYLVSDWNTKWITNPDINLTYYSVTHFRRTFNMTVIPDSFIIHVSADNHYELYVNGRFICMGPSRDDLFHYRYETVDIAGFLKPGKNVIAVQVNNWGINRIKAQFSKFTGLFLTGHSGKEKFINTDEQWKTYYNKAYRENPVEWMYAKEIAAGWYAGNPCDSIFARDYPWQWQKTEYDDSKWKQAIWLASPTYRESPGHSHWLLEPRQIELLEHKQERFNKVTGIKNLEIKKNPFTGADKLEIPANQKVSFLIDQSFETIGYPEMLISGGKGSVIKVVYAENLFDKDRKKGNRNDLKGKSIIGNDDVFIPDGGSGRLFRTTWQRAFRFIQVDVETADDPLVINDYYNIFNSYPVEQKAVFECDNPLLTDIWKAAWRTDKVCAQDILMSDAYYETMQYLADTRIHSLVLYTMTGDDKLYRQAIDQFDHSRISDGLTLAAFPNDWHWVMPYFSLVWVNMVHDYTMISGDREFAKKYMNGVSAVTNWFDDHIDTSGLFGKMPWANSVEDEYHSAGLTATYAYTLNNISKTFDYIGLQNKAREYREHAALLSRKIFQRCYVADSGLLAESPERKKEFSDIANIMGVLANVFPSEDAGKKALEHFRKKYKSGNYLGYEEQFYFMEAIDRTRSGSNFVDLLAPWKTALDQGLTTFPEVPNGIVRSDCHPWSTCPPYYYMRILCGIEPLEPGYKTVRISPELSTLNHIKASWPLYPGVFDMEFNRSGKNGLKGYVHLPAGVKGTLVYNHVTLELKAGTQQIDLK